MYRGGKITQDEQALEPVSWLGRWEDVGWAIRIGRKLTDGEWRAFGKRAEETWDDEARGYSAQAGLTLLGELFPGVTLELMYPRCNKRLQTEGKSSRGLPVYVLCDAPGVVATHVTEAGGSRVCVVRCEAHAGQL